MSPDRAMMKRGQDILGLVLGFCACLAIAGCSTTSASDADGYDEAGYYDPLEPMNRVFFDINDAVDRTLVEPGARSYRDVVPKPARNGVRNFLRNLRSPVNMANQLLQGDVEGFSSDTMRFAINTTIGVVGLIDVADQMGLPYEYEDFGQTLGVWGVGNGPYLVLPVFGPGSVRDHAGFFVDSYADPLRIYLFNTDHENIYYGRVLLAGLDKREALLDILNDLRTNSMDYYAALRSTTYQYREAMVKDKNPDESAAPSIPDYDQ